MYAQGMMININIVIIIIQEDSLLIDDDIMAHATTAASTKWDQTILDINHLVEDHKNETGNELYRGEVR